MWYHHDTDGHGHKQVLEFYPAPTSTFVVMVTGQYGLEMYGPFETGRGAARWAESEVGGASHWIVAPLNRAWRPGMGEPLRGA